MSRFSQRMPFFLLPLIRRALRTISATTLVSFAASPSFRSACCLGRLISRIRRHVLPLRQSVSRTFTSLSRALYHLRHPPLYSPEMTDLHPPRSFFAVPTQQHSNGTATQLVTPLEKPTMPPGMVVEALHQGAPPLLLDVSVSDLAPPCAPAMMIAFGTSLQLSDPTDSASLAAVSHLSFLFLLYAPHFTMTTALIVAMQARTTLATIFTSLVSATAPPTVTSKRLSASMAL